MVKKIKSLDELNVGDVVEMKGRIRSGPHIVVAIGEVPGHEKEVLLHEIHCPECPDYELDYLRAVISEYQVKDSLVKLEKMNKEDYKNWKYVGVKRVE